jgi:nucleolar protein 56
MKENCPNLREVAGSNLGARLIALGGSFERLTKLPASTIQVLGAEKALFRHLKTGAKSPKHGVILQHPLVMHHKEKGKASRQPG